MKTVVYDSDEDRLSWVLGWFHQSTTRASEMEATILCWWGRKRQKAIYVPSYEMATIF